MKKLFVALGVGFLLLLLGGPAHAKDVPLCADKTIEQFSNIYNGRVAVIVNVKGMDSSTREKILNFCSINQVNEYYQHEDRFIYCSINRKSLVGGQQRRPSGFVLSAQEHSDYAEINTVLIVLEDSSNSFVQASIYPLMTCLIAAFEMDRNGNWPNHTVPIPNTSHVRQLLQGEGSTVKISSPFRTYVFTNMGYSQDNMLMIGIAAEK